MGQQYFSHPIDKIQRMLIAKKYQKHNQELLDCFDITQEELHMF